MPRETHAPGPKTHVTPLQRYISTLLTCKVTLVVSYSMEIGFTRNPTQVSMVLHLYMPHPFGVRIEVHHDMVTPHCCGDRYYDGKLIEVTNGDKKEITLRANPAVSKCRYMAMRDCSSIFSFHCFRF